MIKKLYGFLLISFGLAILSQPLAARVLSQLPKFEKWVGSLPDQEILSMTLFEHPTFRQGIEQVIPLEQWNKLWKTYVFSQPVTQIDHWLVVSGHLKDNPGDTDLSIFLDTTTQQVAGVCLSSYSRVYPYYPDAEEPPADHPLHITLVKVEYDIPAGQLVFQATDQFADCGHGDAQKAVKQWLALLVLLGK